MGRFFTQKNRVSFSSAVQPALSAGASFSINAEHCWSAYNACWYSTDLWIVLLRMMPLETKLCVRCASCEEKRRITNDVFVRQVFFSVLFHVISPSYGVFTSSNEEIFERCVQLALPQRQAQLARKQSRGEIAVGEHDIVLTDADLKEIFSHWRRRWQSPDHTQRLQDLSRQACHQWMRNAFNAYLFQSTAGNKELLIIVMRFSIQQTTLSMLPALWQHKSALNHDSLANSVKACSNKSLA